MSAIQDAIAIYADGPRALRAALTGMSREQLLARPIPGSWSALEVVAHLADFEPVYVDRMKRVIALDDATMAGADENLFAANLGYQERDLDEELAVVEACRRSMTRTLKGLSDATFARTGVHSERGRLTLLDLVGLAGRHVTHHVAFVDAKRKALGL